MSSFFTLWRREFSAIFLSPIAYVMLMFFFPVVSSQLFYEQYISATERFGNERGYEETRSFTDFLFPWRTNSGG